jgi:PAS domain S-box-containing protein
MGIRFRIILAISLITSLMVAITLFYTNIRQFATLKENLIEQTRVNLQIIVEYSNETMISEDKEDATEVLLKLKKVPHLVSAVIYDLKYVPFASFGADSIQQLSQGDKFFLDDLLFRNNKMFMSVPISLNGRRLGSLIAEIDLNFRRQQQLEEALLLITLFLFLVIISVILAYFIGGSMVKPLLLLSRKMKSISGDKNFEEQIDIFREDEIGGLIHGYNYMLSQLSKWKIKQIETEAALRNSNEILELKVTERTLDLSLAHEKVQNHLQNERAILGNLPYGIVLIDENSEIIEINKFALEMLGYTSNKPKYIHEISEESWHSGGEMLSQSLNIEPDHSRQSIFISQDGTPVPVLKSDMNIQYNQKEVRLKAFVDISDLKKTQQELIKAMEMAQESDRLKSAFLATVNHELRTPLTHILGFSALIKSGVEPDDARSFAVDIETSGKNLLSIIEDIFYLALAEEDTIKLRNQSFNVIDHFKENRSSFENMLHTSGKQDQIKLIFKPQIDIDLAYYRADKSKINHVLSHLFRNAIKFTGKGAIEVGFSITNSSLLTYYVKDTGIGISKEMLLVIFDFFRQGDESLSRAYEGLGIGLAISLRISKLLNGTLTVESEPGKGSTFYFSVPLEVIPTLAEADNSYWTI